MPDTETVIATLGFLGTVWTAFQEWRHRKNKKAGVYGRVTLRDATAKGPLATKPLKGRK